MSTIKLIGGMAFFVVLGAPLVWYLWQVLNDLLQGIVNPLHLLVAVPVLLLFLGLLALVSRAVARWEASPSRDISGENR